MNIKKIPYWPIFIGLISFAYIIYELVFNARMVELASSSSSTANEIDMLARSGEILSGVGLSLSLLALMRIYKPFAKLGFFASFAALLLLVVICIPFMKWAQPAIINAYVDSTTAEERALAVNLNFFRLAAANEGMQINGEVIGNKPHDKTMLALIGPMALTNKTVQNFIESNKLSIIDRIMIKYENDADYDNWSSYRMIQSDVRLRYDQYKMEANRYLKAKPQQDKIANDIIVEMRRKLKREHDQYKRRSVTFENKYRNAEPHIVKTLSAYFSDYNNVSLSRRYENELKHVFKSIPAPESYAHSKGKFGNDPIREGKWNVQSIRDGHRNLIGEAFKQNFNGVSRGLTYQKFLSDPAVCRQTRVELARNKINMPEDWCPADEGALYYAVGNDSGGNARRKWEEETKRRTGEVLRTNLTYEEFKNLSAIKKDVAESLSSVKCVNGNAYLSQEVFTELCLKEGLNEAKAELHKNFIIPLSELEDGRSREEDGKSAVRALIVPPFAMGLSLFFSILALMNLIAGMIPTKGYLTGLKYLTLAALVLAPAFTPLSKHGAMVDFALEKDSAFRPLTTWIINTQPVLYSISKDFKVTLPGNSFTNN